MPKDGGGWGHRIHVDALTSNLRQDHSSLHHQPAAPSQLLYGAGYSPWEGVVSYLNPLLHLSWTPCPTPILCLLLTDG